jgi:hypothetical protein
VTTRFVSLAKLVVPAKLAVLVILLQLACAPPAPRTEGPTAGEIRCDPVSGTTTVAVDADDLAGEYRLTLVADRGSAAGDSAEGRLWLHTNEAELRGIPSASGGIRRDASAPLHGWTDVAVEAVGAVRPGDVSSRDPAAPGVLVIQEDGRLLLRLGSEANRRDVLRFDGGYTVLRVERATEGGFAGTWSSGLVEFQAGGAFCARRE